MKSGYRLKVILLLLMYLPIVCFAQQEISGSQSGILGPGIYNVVGNIQVDSGENLTIVSGTTFNHNGNYKWTIYGAFNAVGAENDSIYFICEGSGWKGIRFMNDAPAAVLDYCVIDNCDMGLEPNYFAGISVNGGDGLTLTHSRVSNCFSVDTCAGIYVANSVVFLDSCLILNNTVVNHQKGAGIYLKDCADSQILNTVIAYNHSVGGV